MNILQIASQVPVPETDGGKISVFGITKILKQMGHKIDFLCYLKDADYVKSVNLMKNYCEPFLIKVNTKNNIVDAAKNLFSQVPYNASKYRKKELIEFVTKLLKKNRYDIIQVEHLHMGWIVDYIKKIVPYKIPVILREQNLETKIMERYYQQEKNLLLKMYSFIQYKKFLKFEPSVCKKFDSCVMISESDKKELLALDSGINAISIPAGIDNKLLTYPLHGKPVNKKIVHIGNLDWYPNLEGLNWYLSKIFPGIIKAIPDVELYVYGGGNFKNLKINANIKNNVKLIGFVDNLWEELLDKDLAIVPLRVGSGIRIKILEMLAYGIGVISTSVGKEGINAEDNKHILIADEPEKFVTKTLQFFNGEIDGKLLTGNGRNFIAENYTWEIIGQRFINLYNNLLAI